MIYEIFHKTLFSYNDMVTFSHNLARIKPLNNAYQNLLNFDMQILPEAQKCTEFVDIFGNSNVHILIREAHKEMSVVGKSRVEIHSEKIAALHQSIQANSITYKEAIERLAKFTPQDISPKKFLFESDLIPQGSKKIKDYALQSFEPNRDLFAAGSEFMTRIYEDFEFVSGFSDITTPIEEIFEAKKGVCQDFAQFAISALRSIGLPAKYMSGYIETIPPEGEEKLFGIDASHAWFSLYIPNAGWIDFDPTNNIIPNEQHIVLGSGKDYNDISPLKGVVMSSGQSNLSVVVDVRRVTLEPPLLGI